MKEFVLGIIVQIKKNQIMKHGLQVMTVVLWAKKYILQEEKKVQDAGMTN